MPLEDAQLKEIDRDEAKSIADDFREGRISREVYKNRLGRLMYKRQLQAAGINDPKPSGSVGYRRRRNPIER